MMTDFVKCVIHHIFNEMIINLKKAKNGFYNIPYPNQCNTYLALTHYMAYT